MPSGLAEKRMDIIVADEEWQLMARIAAGERDAFGELYARHRASLLVYIRSLTGDPGLAEEVLQDTLFAAWTGAQRFARRSSVRIWLLGIARRRAYDALRRQAKSLSDAAALEELPATEPEPESLAIVGSERETLHAAMWRLSPAHREVLVLNFLEELPYRDIANVLDVPIGTVMSRLHHAKRSLRAELTREGQP